MSNCVQRECASPVHGPRLNTAAQPEQEIPISLNIYPQAMQGCVWLFCFACATVRDVASHAAHDPLDPPMRIQVLERRRCEQETLGFSHA